MFDIEFIESMGYTHVREINGKYYGIYRFIFTTGLVVNIDDVGYESRFCYPNHTDAIKALECWSGIGDPPGNWIKQKGLNGDRSNPNEGYFIPTIEDFHDGIVYEMKQCFTDGTVKTLEQFNTAKWEERIYSSWDKPYIERALSGKNSEILPAAIRMKIK